jgi:hypothetical protein
MNAGIFAEALIQASPGLGSPLQSVVPLPGAGENPGPLSMLKFAEDWRPWKEQEAQEAVFNGEHRGWKCSLNRTLFQRNPREPSQIITERRILRGLMNLALKLL